MLRGLAALLHGGAALLRGGCSVATRRGQHCYAEGQHSYAETERCRTPRSDVCIQRAALRRGRVRTRHTTQISRGVPVVHGRCPSGTRCRIAARVGVAPCAPRVQRCDTVPIAVRPMRTASRPACVHDRHKRQDEVTETHYGYRRKRSQVSGAPVLTRSLQSSACSPTADEGVDA